MSLTATPTKLRNGTWGASVRGGASSGDVIEITARSGKRWTATVDRVLWTGASRYGEGTVSIVSTRAHDATSSRRYRSDCCGYPCPVDGHRCTPDHPCHDCA